LPGGALDPLDVLLTVPYLRLGAAVDGTPGQSGLADVSLDIKWRFYETGTLSVALIRAPRSRPAMKPVTSAAGERGGAPLPS